MVAWLVYMPSDFSELKGNYSLPQIPVQQEVFFCSSSNSMSFTVPPEGFGLHTMPLWELTWKRHRQKMKLLTAHVFKSPHSFLMNVFCFDWRLLYMVAISLSNSLPNYSLTRPTTYSYTVSCSLWNHWDSSKFINLSKMDNVMGLEPVWRTVIYLIQKKLLQDNWKFPLLKKMSSGGFTKYQFLQSLLTLVIKKLLYLIMSKLEYLHLVLLIWLHITGWWSTGYTLELHMPRWTKSISVNKKRQAQSCRKSLPWSLKETPSKIHGYRMESGATL